MAYGSEEGVEAIVPAAGLIGASSIPTTTQLAAWLEEGAARIDRVLGSAGYVVPVVALTAPSIYAELRALNNLYAGAYVLRARGLDRMQGTEENRSDVWLAEFRDTLAELAASDLVAGGVVLVEVVVVTERRRIRSLRTRRVDGYTEYNESYINPYTYPYSHPRAYPSVTP